MNRFHLLALCGLALIAVPVFQDSGRSAEAGNTTVKVAVVDLERTLYETPAGKRADKKFEKTRKKKQAELQQKFVDLQQLYVKLEKDLASERTKLIKDLLKQAEPIIEELAKA